MAATIPVFYALLTYELSPAVFICPSTESVPLDPKASGNTANFPGVANLSYSVTWTRLYEADNAPLDEIFQQTADEVVTLITCGGAFDQSAHMYVSRWVVRGVRTPSAD